MTSKERAKAAINKKKVDKVPFGTYVVDCDTVSRVIGRKTYVRNKVDMQIAFWEGRRDEVVESLKADSVEFFKKMDVIDILTLKEAPMVPPKDYDPDPPKRIDDDTFEDKRGRILKASRDANEIAVVHDPTKNESSISTASYPLPNIEDEKPIDESCFEVSDHFIKEMGADRYILGYAQLACMPMLGGMENGLMMFGLYPEFVQEYAEAGARVQDIRDQYMVRPGVDGVMIEEDMGGTNGPLISPDQWREISKPVLTSRVRNINNYVNDVVLHCCGNTIPVMDMIAETGIECYQSLQTFAGMAPGRLCREFGDRLSFWGGMATEYLIGGTAEDSRKAVREAMEETVDYPGFILGPSHSVAYGTIYDNFMAALDEFDRLRDRKAV